MPTIALFLKFIHSWFKSQRNLVIENMALMQQVPILRRSVKHPRPSMADKLFWILLARYKSDWRNALHVLHPVTVMRGHREGFRHYWRWKGRGPKPGRPPIDVALRQLIREMQATNVGWGAPRIHGESLKLGIAVSEATVSKLYAASEKANFTVLENLSQQPCGVWLRSIL